MFPPVVAHLMADIHDFTAKMGEAEAIAGKVSGSSAASWQQAGKQLMTIGGVMAVAAGAVAGETIHMATEFQSYMERVHTQAGASQREVDTLGQKVLDLAVATGQGPDKLAEALYHVESVGYRGSTAMAVLTDSAKLAAISGADLDATTYGLTSVMQTFGASAKDSAKYAALFNSTVGAGDMQMEAFNRAVGTGFYSTAQTFGISAQSASGALAFMTDRGEHADEAATRLRMTIALMAAPSARATKILGSLGLTTDEVAKSHIRVNGVLKKSGITYSQLATDMMKPDGFYVALSHLKKSLEDSGMSAQAANAQLSHAFGGGKSDSTILAMLNNLDTLKSKYEAVGKGMGTYAESFNAAQKTTGNQINMLKSSLQALGIEIGQQLMPYALVLIGWLRDGAAWAEKHTGAVKALAMIIGVTLVAGLVLATSAAIGLAAATIEIWGPVALIIVGVMALVAAVVYVWTHWQQAWGWIVGLAKDVADWLSQTWKAIAQAASIWWGQIMAHTVTPVAKGAATVWGWIVWIKDRIVLGLKLALAWVAASWNAFYSVAIAPVVRLARAIPAWMSSTSGTITKWLHTALSWASSTWNSFYSHAIAPIVELAQRVGAWMQSVYKSITAWFGSVVKWLGGLGSSFYNVGRNIVLGIIKGITDLASWAWNQVVNFASNLLGGVKSFLGISSPSKLFADEVGKQIPAGIAVGITANAHLAGQSLEGMAEQLTTQTSVAVQSAVTVPHLPFAVASAAPSSAPPLPVTVTNVTKLDGKVLFTATQTHALQYKRRNGIPAFG